MKKIAIISTLILTLVIAIASFTSIFANENARQNNRPSMRTVLQNVFAIGDELRNLAKDVNLTDSQKQQIKAIVITAKPQAEEFRTQLETKRKELRTELLSNNPDSVRVERLSQDLANLTCQITVFRVHTVTEISQVLTLEQKQTALKELAAIDPLVDELKENIEALAINSNLLK